MSTFLFISEEHIFKQSKKGMYKNYIYEKYLLFKRCRSYLVQYMILFVYKHPQNSLLTILVIRFRIQFYPKKKFLSLYSNMAAPNVNDRLHLTGVHQKPPASLYTMIF